MKNLFGTLALAVLSSCYMAPVMAQSNCGPHADLTDHLAENYGESRQMIAINSRGIVVEIYANTATGTWSVVATGPEGPSCLVDEGRYFELTPSEPVVEGDPA